MRNYEQHEVIRKLQNAGLKPMYNKKKKLRYFERPKRVRIGQKLWGMIDFLKVNVVKA